MSKVAVETPGTQGKPEGLLVVNVNVILVAFAISKTDGK